MIFRVGLKCRLTFGLGRLEIRLEKTANQFKLRRPLTLRFTMNLPAPHQNSVSFPPPKMYEDA